MLTERIEVLGDHLTLSLIVWRRFKRPMPGLVELTLDTNQDMAELGNVLPVGYVFFLPIPTEQQVQVLAPIKLW